MKITKNIEGFNLVLNIEGIKEIKEKKNGNIIVKSESAKLLLKNEKELIIAADRWFKKNGFTNVNVFQNGSEEIAFRTGMTSSIVFNKKSSLKTLVAAVDYIYKMFTSNNNILFHWEITENEKQQMLSSEKWKNWHEKVSNNFKINTIFIEKINFFGNRVGFIKLYVDAINRNNKHLPGIVNLRGDSVSVLFIINYGNEKYAALVEQGRTPVGDYIFENPAGMMDEDNHVAGVAIKEVEEELGVKIESENLEKLGWAYTSPGGQDEKVTYYSHEITMSKEEMANLDNKVTGEDGSNEDILVKLVGLNEYQEYNHSAIGQLAFFEYCKKNNIIIDQSSDSNNEE